MSGHDREREETFELPGPPPLPHGFEPPPDADVVFVRRVAGPPRGEGRDGEDIMLRRVRPDVATRFRAAAGGRGLTHAQYLAALVELHETLRRRADAGDESVQAELARFGLTSVTV
jgi:hypothetical protein